jgi:dihydroflavonol-4-reductase
MMSGYYKSHWLGITGVNMKIVILGATGFIGSHVAEQCALAGEEVTCLVRASSNTDFLKTLNVDIQETDFTGASLALLMKSADVVMNCIARPELHIDINDHRAVDVELTGKAFVAARSARVKRFIQLSTVQVYGFKRPPTAVNEDYPVLGQYAFNQVAIEREQYLQELAQGGETELVMLRPTNTVGARDPNFKAIVDTQKQGFFPQFNRGVAFSCIDTRDVGRAMLLLAQKATLNHDCYLVKGFDIEWLEVNELLGEITGKKAKMLYLPEMLMMPIAWLMEKLVPYGKNPPLIPFSVKVLATNTLFDDSRIREEGFEPKHEAKAMLSAYLESL